MSFDNLVSFKFDSIEEEFRLSFDEDIVIESNTENLRLIAENNIIIRGRDEVRITGYEEVGIRTGEIVHDEGISPLHYW